MSAAAPLHPPLQAPLKLLVVCSRGEHLESVRGVTRDWTRSTQIHWTADPAEAMRRALAEPMALAIVDARLDRASGCQLSRALTQSRDATDVMSFDEPGAATTCGRASTWHWSELSRAIGWWVQRQLQAGAPVRFQ